MEDEVKTTQDVAMTSSVTETSASNSSDNESWTILDEEEESTSTCPQEETLRTRVDVVQKVAEFTKFQPHPESDSDIETIDEKHAESNLESLNSDGIPIHDENLEEPEIHQNQQYLWSSETDLTTSTSTQTFKSSDQDNLEDDLEIIEPKSDSLLSSGYPPEELMEHFSKIVKGRTYLHRPNRTLNLYLTGTLILVGSLVIGLGLGHFKGWSERLELQEQYADIREERMDELTESLVTCMTQTDPSLDNQDLDNIVIKQLQDENERLKSELQLLRDTNDLDNSANEEMNAILRDRINDLLVGNADLEKQVAKLRYSSPIPNADDQDEVELLETKEELNHMAHENDQLKIVIAKERYGPRQVPVEAKQRLNILTTENEELKSEVRKFRYGVHAPTFDSDETFSNDTLDILEEGSDAIDAESIEEPNFITLSRLQSKPVLPPVIMMGGKTNQDDLEDEGFVEDFDEDEFVEGDEETFEDLDQDDQDSDETDEPFQDYFKSFQKFMESNQYKFDVALIGKVINEFEKNAKDLLPNEEQISKIKQSAEELGSVLKEKWSDLGQVIEKNKLKDKLTQTIVKALDKAKDTFDEELNVESWSQRLNHVQEKFQSKWQEVMSKFAKFEQFNRPNQKSGENKKESCKKETEKKESKPDEVMKGV